MKKEDALKLIDQVLQAYRGSRQEHVAIQQAFEAISKLVEPVKKKE